MSSHGSGGSSLGQASTTSSISDPLLDDHEHDGGSGRGSRDDNLAEEEEDPSIGAPSTITSERESLLSVRSGSADDSSSALSRRSSRSSGSRSSRTASSLSDRIESLHASQGSLRDSQSSLLKRLGIQRDDDGNVIGAASAGTGSKPTTPPDAHSFAPVSSAVIQDSTGAAISTNAPAAGGAADEGRLARVQMSDEGHPPPRQCGTATVSSHSDEDDSFSEISIATADAKPSGERRKPVSSFDLPSATPMVTSPMSVHTQYALTPSRSCPSFSNLQLSSPTILEPLPPTEPTERQIEREVEEHRRLACFLMYGEAPLPQDIKNYKSPTCSQRPEPRRKEKGVYLPFKQVPGWGSEVAVTTVLGMIEVDRQVREGRGAYPKGWRSRELGLYDNKTIEFSIALSTDKIALDAYKLGYEDGSKQPTAHPALTDNKLADAYGVKRGKIRQSLHAVWLSNDHKKAKEAKKNTGRNRRTKKPTVIKTNQCCCILHVDL